jgi:hypothetical protein
MIYYDGTVHHKSAARSADVEHTLGIFNDIFFLSIDQVGRGKISAYAGRVSQNLSATNLFRNITDIWPSISGTLSVWPLPKQKRKTMNL